MSDNKEVGRPTLYNQALADTICKQVALGKSLRSIGALPAMPSKRTIAEWLADDDKKEFLHQYQLAYKIQMMLVFDEMRDIVNEATVADIPKVREQISLAKWLLKIHEPKRFGDNPEPVTIIHNPAPDLSNLTIEEKAQWLALKRKMNNNS